MKKLLILLLNCSSILVAQKAWEGNHYQATCRPQYEMATFAIDQLPTKHYKSILDIGCGSGDFTLQLTKHADYVLGVDYSASMIKKAQELYGNKDNLDFNIDDIRTLQNINQTFDLITAFHPIQWIPASDQHKAFNQMAQHLNPDGICMVLVSDKYNIFYEPLIKTVNKKKWRKYIPNNIEPWNWQTVGSISSSFEQAGLRPLKVFVWYKKYFFESKDTFINFMKNWFCNANHFNYIPQEKHDKLFDEIMKSYLQSINYVQNSPVEFESPFIIGIAQKHGESVEKQTPKHLYKIVSMDQWEQSKNKNNLILSDMDKDFIHFSTNADQVNYVVNKYWKNKPYILLTIDTQKTPGAYKLEWNSKKTDQFWHLYNGGLPHSAIVEKVYCEIK